MAVTKTQVAYEAAGHFGNTPANLVKYATAFLAWLTGTLAYTVAVTNKALTTNVATLTVPTGHGIRVGDSVTVAGVDATFNGVVTVTAVTATSISYALVHADVVSAAATGTTTTGVVIEQAYAALRSVVIRPRAAYGTPALVLARADKVLVALKAVDA